MAIPNLRNYQPTSLRYCDFKGRLIEAEELTNPEYRPCFRFYFRRRYLRGRPGGNFLYAPYIPLVVTPTIINHALPFKIGGRMPKVKNINHDFYGVVTLGRPMDLWVYYPSKNRFYKLTNDKVIRIKARKRKTAALIKELSLLIPHVIIPPSVPPAMAW